MSFYLAAVATSIAGLILGLGWLFAGTLLLKRWGLETNASGLLVGRRLGVVYVTTALLLFLGRSAPPSELRSVVAISMLASMGLLALLGLIEFKAGRAGKGILASVAVEIILAGSFGLVLLD